MDGLASSWIDPHVVVILSIVGASAENSLVTAKQHIRLKMGVGLSNCHSFVEVPDFGGLALRLRPALVVSQGEVRHRVIHHLIGAVQLTVFLRAAEAS